MLKKSPIKSITVQPNKHQKKRAKNKININSYNGIDGRSICFCSIRKFILIKFIQFYSNVNVSFMIAIILEIYGSIINDAVHGRGERRASKKNMKKKKIMA